MYVVLESEPNRHASNDVPFVLPLSKGYFLF